LDLVDTKSKFQNLSQARSKEVKLTIEQLDMVVHTLSTLPETILHPELYGGSIGLSIYSIDHDH